MSNPDKFPLGRGGFNDPRRTENPISLQKYANARFYDADGRFGDVEYILSMQYALESKQVNDSISIFMRKRDKTGKRLSAGLLKDLSNITNMMKADIAFQLLKEIRGSPPYWQVMLYNALAMIRQLGIPTWFLTLSAADMKWPDIIQSIAAQYGTIYTDDQVKALSWEQRSMWIRTNPVTAARQFQFRLETFFTDFLKSKACPIGLVTDFLLRIEFQTRGSPHCHSLIWIQDAPKLNHSKDEDVIAFIDKYVSCEIPEDDEELKELVTSLQTHSHSSYCRRNGKCRFNVPKPPSSKTLIAREATGELAAQELESACEILSAVRDVLNDKEIPNDITIEEVLERANVTSSNYEKALSTTKSGESIILKRKPNAKRTNQYNPAIIRAWEANTDMQYITNAFACVMYIASYVLKPEKGMGHLLKQTAKEMANEDIQKQLRKLGSVFLTHREISAQEAVYRANSMPLRHSSRQVIYINTDFKEERISLVLSKAKLDQLEDDNEEVFSKNCIDRYAARPDELEQLTLAEFVADWRVVYGKASEDQKEDDDTVNPEVIENPDAVLPSKLKLKNRLGTISRRRTRAVIRWHKFNKEKEPEKYYRSKLMLYTPWRDEDALIGNYILFEDRYTVEEEEIKLKEAEFNHNANEIDEAYALLQQNGPPEHAWEDLAPGTEEGEAAAEEEGIIDERPMTEEDIANNADITEIKKHNKPSGSRSDRLHKMFTKEACKDILSNQEYNRCFRMLNKKQKELVLYHRKWCKEVVLCHKQGKPTKPYFLFLSGPGGVGKSFVIKMIHTDTVRLLRNSPVIGMQDVSILLTASTGVASFNIDGSTVHSALALTVKSNKKDTTYHSLPSEVQQTLETDLEHLQVIVIDEISMVGARMLYEIHRRLQDIKKMKFADTRFGNVALIGSGDLYQLGAIGDHQVFKAAGDPDSDTPVYLHGSMWQECFKLHELNEIMRQRDQEFGHLLNTIRSAQPLSKRQMQMLESRFISKDDPNYFKDALHVYALNEEADGHNAIRLAQLPGEEFVSEAIIDKKDRRTKHIEVDFSDMKRAETGGLHVTLKLKKGAVMKMVSNVSVADGLTNGARGIVQDIKYHIETKTGKKKIDCILFKFFDPRVGTEAKASSPFKRQYPDCVPIYTHTTTFLYKKHAEFMITGFPLTLSFASTIHTVQGLTLDRIVVDFSCISRKGQAYVALSRVRSLDGLQILNFKKTAIKKNPEVEKEMERLRNNTIESEIQECQIAKMDDQWFKVAHLNVRNYLAHYEDVKQTDGLSACDVICFTETHLKPSLHIPPTKQPHKNLIPFRFDREGGMDKGGILIYAHPKYKPLHLTGIDIKDLEFGAISLQPGIWECSTQILPERMNILTIYRRPDGTTIDNFLARLEKLFEHPKLKGNIPTIVLGDFNEDLMPASPSKIVNFMEDFNFNLVTGLHHKEKVPTTDYGSCLDHIYTNFKAQYITKATMFYEVYDAYFSDHDTTYIALNKMNLFGMDPDQTPPTSSNKT